MKLAGTRLIRLLDRYCSKQGPKPKEADSDEWARGDHCNFSAGFPKSYLGNIIYGGPPEGEVREDDWRKDGHGGIAVTVVYVYPMLCGTCHAPIHQRELEA